MSEEKEKLLTEKDLRNIVREEMKNIDLTPPVKKHNIKEHYHFCEDCGEENKNRELGKECDDCGQKVNKNAKYCHNCGGQDFESEEED